MSMDAVMKIMRDAGWGSLATTDGEEVGVRPMAGWAWMGGELWCATGRSSDKVRQLRKVSRAEYCFCTREGPHVRISGSCAVSEDEGDKRKLYEANHIVRDHIPDPASAEYAVIRMKPDRIRMMVTEDFTYEDVEPPG